MITFEMLYAAIFSFVGLSALVVALTQVLKNAFKTSEKWPDKKWPNHLLSFITSLVCTTAVLFIGIHYNLGVFSEFCLSCVDSWLTYVGAVIGCTGMANGLWSYNFMQKILEWIKLLPKVEPDESENE